MQTQYITKRQVTVPEKAPKALHSLLTKTQEGISAGGGLDTVRWLHDSLVFLTEFFASFAVGSLKTVGPYSPSVEALLQQPPSLDRSERMLSQAFVDWKAHPHHPAYESLRETFYLTSRLQSSRFAPRRHTRWLGVEGRAVAGLERLTRWSRRIDLAVSAKDEAAAQAFVEKYTPVLWTWTDALEPFFKGWSVQVTTEITDGTLGLTGSASRDDVRLELIALKQLTGLKSQFASDGNGGVVLNGFVPVSGFAAPAATSAEAAVATPPMPTVAPVAPAAEEDLQLVFDPVSGNYVGAGGVAETNAPDFAAPVDVSGPEFTLDLSPDLDLASPVESEIGLSIPGPEDLPEIPALEEPTPSEAPLFSSVLGTPTEEAVPEPPAAVDESPLFESTLPSTPEAAPADELPSLDLPMPSAEIGLGIETSGSEAPPLDLDLELSLPPVERSETAEPPVLGDTPVEIPSAEPFPDSLESTLSEVDPKPEAGLELPDSSSNVTMESVEASSGGPAEVDLSGVTDLPSSSDSTLSDLGLEAGQIEPLSAPLSTESVAVEAAESESPSVPDLSFIASEPVEEAPLFNLPLVEPVSDAVSEQSGPSLELPPIEPAGPGSNLPPVFIESEQPLALEESRQFGHPEPTEVSEALDSLPSPTELTAPLSPSVESPDFHDSVEEDAPSLSYPGFAEPLEETPPIGTLAPAEEVSEVEPPTLPGLPNLEPAIEEVADPAPVFETPAIEEVSDPAPVFETPAIEEVSGPAPVFEMPAIEEVSDPAPVFEMPAIEEVSDPAPVFEMPAIEEVSDPAPVFEMPAIEEVSDPAPVFESPAATAASAVSAIEEPSFSPSPEQEAPTFDITPPTATEPESLPPLALAAEEASSGETPDTEFPPIAATSGSFVLDSSSEEPIEEPASGIAEPSGPDQVGEQVAVGLPVSEPLTGQDSLDELSLSPEPPGDSVPRPGDPASPEPEEVALISDPTAPQVGAEEVTEPPLFESPRLDLGVEPVQPTPVPIVPSFESSTPAAPPDFTAPPSVPETPVFSLPETPGPSDFSPPPSTEFIPPARVETVTAPTFHSVEIDTPSINREMGASAEEILEDSYEFSIEDGPVRPQWRGWNVQEREDVQAVCEQQLAQSGRLPSAFAGPILEALKGGPNKLQVLIEPACGKSSVARGLVDALSESGQSLVVLASWDDVSNDGLASTELLRFYDELRLSKRRTASQLVLPEPQAVAALAVSADKEGLPQAFQRFVGQLSQVNKSPLVIVVDQPPSKLQEFLAFTPPASVSFIILVDPSQAAAPMGPVVDLQRRWKAASAEVFGESARAFFDHEAATFLRIALATELKALGADVPASLEGVKDKVFDNPSLDEEFLAVLSLEDGAISLDDLDQWYLEANKVVQTLQSFPALFEVEKSRLSPLIGLSHCSIRQFVDERFADTRTRAARKLLGWVVTQLERTGPDKYGGLQVREIVFRNFLRLYRYAQLSQDTQTLEWVMRNKDLQRRRVALTSHLEKPASRYELQTLLMMIADLLASLVDTGNCDDLRDELAWARSNLALNQMKLGLIPQAKDEIAVASELFETLVNKEKQYEFRPALSTTYFRASQIFEAADDVQTALDFANRSVQGFVDLVEDRGRAELAPRLGLALAHRGGLFCQQEQHPAAKADLQRAAKILEGGEVSEDITDSYRTLVEIQLELSTILIQEGDLENAILESGKAVKLATEALEEKGIEEFQPLLATCHAVRAKAYFKLKDSERALRDIAKSVSLRNLSVDEGRLDQRFHLAKDLQLRAQIDQSRGALEDAARDLGRAVQLLETLVTEGRSDASAQLLRCLQDKASICLAAGDSATGTADLKRALGLLVEGDPKAAELRLAIMESLLQAYLQTGNTEEALSISQGLLAFYHQAQSWEPYSRIQLVRGEALENRGDLSQALECYNQSVTLVSQLLAQGQTDELLSRVSQAYLGVGSAEFKLGRNATAAAQCKRAIDVYLHLFQQRKKPEVLPSLLKAYSLFASANLGQHRLAEAKQALKSGFDVLGYLESQGGKGGVPMPRGLEQLKGELYRQRSAVLLADGDVSNALADAEEASRNFLLTRQQGSTTWRDELGRISTLRCRILFALKDFAQAEKSIQEAIAHFEERIRQNHFEFFPDLMKAFSVRAENAARTGKVDLVLEEYNRMLTMTAAVAKSGAAIDHELEMAKIFERRARVYRDQSLLNEAYADYENVIGLYRNLVTTKGRAELANELIRVYIERGSMTTKAGHGQHAVNDFTEAVNVAKALVGQGQVTSVPELATALHKRAEVYRGLGRGAEALQDLEGAIGFRMQLAQTSQEPELMGELGRALLLQGTLLVQAGQAAHAAASLDKANAFFTNLVEGQGRQEFSSELAQGLIQRVSLSNDRSDPALREVLIKAVNLVTQQARDGKPVGRDFSIECLKTVVELLQREDFETVGSLIDSVLNLVEVVVTDGRAEQDFVKLTDLLLAASAGLIDDRRTARRPHFLSLACVSCNREIQMFGKNSLPRLVYCLYELGQALERSKPPGVLNYVGSSFALLGELASQQQTNEDFLRELKMMVSTWRSLPPQIPALANVSRHMLSQLLRLT